jgi:hypothetical protein
LHYQGGVRSSGCSGHDNLIFSTRNQAGARNHENDLKTHLNALARAAQNVCQQGWGFGFEEIIGMEKHTPEVNLMTGISQNFGQRWREGGLLFCENQTDVASVVEAMMSFLIPELFNLSLTT